MVRRGSVWLLVGALLAGLLTVMTGSAAQAADGIRYYYSADPENGFGGYVLRIRFSGNTAYLLEPSKNAKCLKAKRVAANTWRYKQPIAAEEGDPVPAWFKTNKARSTVWIDDQYEDYERTYRRITRAQADRWLRKTGASQSWSRRC